MLENLHYTKQLGQCIKLALEQGNTRRFGELMHEHWMHKKERSPGTTNEGINRWYEIGRENGAVGGKLVGAGGGGFLLFYADDRDALRRAMVNEGLQRVPLQIRSRRVEAAVPGLRSANPMQCVILAGGLGTRMRPLTETCPKTLLPARGRPFAWHQLHWLAAQGITEVVYSIGHHGDMIRRYWSEERFAGSFHSLCRRRRAIARYGRSIASGARPRRTRRELLRHLWRFVFAS